MNILLTLMIFVAASTSQIQWEPYELPDEIVAPEPTPEPAPDLSPYPTPEPEPAAKPTLESDLTWTFVLAVTAFILAAWAVVMLMLDKLEKQ